MAFKVHTVARYNYCFDARAGRAGTLQLWGEQQNKLAQISFVDDNAAVPPPRLWPNLAGADACFKSSALAPIIDMLRNESPVSITVNDQPPGFFFLQTGAEPAGEGEGR